MTTPTFTFVHTEDGSPTVRIGSGEELSEAMHSLKGAFSETMYIYGAALETCLEKNFPPRVLSLGLGLGYVEILAAGLFLKKANSLPHDESVEFLSSVGGESFEILPSLREWFTGWLRESNTTPEDFKRAYRQISELTSQSTGVSPQEIKSFLLDLIESGSWKIREALGANTEFTSPFGCICFDAFSSKTSPELWTEDFLTAFLRRACAPQSVLSTYACTGALKRSLRTSGFQVEIKQGFSNKRDSTYAVRESESA